MHKLDLHYSNGERKDRRAEEALEMFKSLGELSRRGAFAALPEVRGRVMVRSMKQSECGQHRFCEISKRLDSFSGGG